MYKPDTETDHQEKITESDQDPPNEIQPRRFQYIVDYKIGMDQSRIRRKQMDSDPGPIRRSGSSIMFRKPRPYQI